MSSGSGFFVRTTSGGDPKQIVPRLKKAATPTVGDALYAGQRQRTRILDRTARGVDVNGRPFKPYSENGPYYYNPNGRLTAASRAQIGDKTQKGAAKRFLSNITTKAQREKGGAPTVSRTGRTVKFESYAAFKKWLGRAVVDLRGARSPHMLQAIAIKVGGYILGGEQDAAGVQSNSQQPATEMRIGIYGDAAQRATGHNTGPDTGAAVPKREFFGASAADIKQMARDVLARIQARLGRA